MTQHDTRSDLSEKFVADWQVPAFEVLEWLGRRSTVCIVIPVINEGERVHRLLGRLKASNYHEKWDVVIVDGGSTDGSVTKDLPETYGVRGVLVKTGIGGLSAQLRCGYAFVLSRGYTGVITIDGNDKDDPAAIPRFAELLEEGYDFIQGSRFVAGGVSENTPWSRLIAIRLVHAPLLSLCSGFKWTDTTQGFRGYSHSVLLDKRVGVFRDVFRSYELLAYLSYKVPRLGYRCIESPTARRYPIGLVPTKISKIRGNWDVLATLVRACCGCYDVSEQRVKKVASQRPGSR